MEAGLTRTCVIERKLRDVEALPAPEDEPAEPAGEGGSESAGATAGA